MYLETGEVVQTRGCASMLLQQQYTSPPRSRYNHSRPCKVAVNGTLSTIHNATMPVRMPRRRSQPHYIGHNLQTACGNHKRRSPYGSGSGIRGSARAT